MEFSRTRSSSGPILLYLKRLYYNKLLLWPAVGTLARADSRVIAELQGVNKIYGSGDLEVKALDCLDLIVREGDYLAVMGASGSGKSTAMNILGCLDRPTSGSYRLNNMAVDQFDEDALADVRNRSLGFVFQQFHSLSGS